MGIRKNGGGRLARRRRMNRVLETVLADIDAPSPFDISKFCDALAHKRGRAIKLVPMSPLLDGEHAPPFSGLWLGGKSTDYLFYDDTTSPFHQQNSLLHEVGHMLLDHQATGEPDDVHVQLFTMLMPNVAPDVVRNSVRAGLCRSTSGLDGFTNSQERDAESLAALIWERYSGMTSDRSFHPTLDAADADAVEDAEVISRMAEVLSRPRKPGRAQ